MERNPFFVGPRVPPESFVGRKTEIEIAFEQIQNRSHLAIWGGPGMGKSSFLDKIASPQVWEEHGLDPSQAVIVLFSCLNISPFTACGFWKEILSNMRDILDSEPELQTEIDKQLETELTTKESVRQILRLLGRKDKYLVLLVDDYDVALRENPQYTQGEMLKFLSECRNLACHSRERRYLSMIVTSLQRLNELGPPLDKFRSPWYNHYLFQSLRPFTALEFQQLLSVLPQIPPAIQNTIGEIAGGHPAILQYAGFLLYRELRDAKEGQVVDAKAFVKNFESDTKHIFQYIWARCSEEEQSLLMLVALFGLKSRLHKQNYDLSGIKLIFSQKERDLTSLEEQGVLVRTKLPKDKDIENIPAKGVIIRTEQGEKKILSFASSVMERWVIQELGNHTNDPSLQQKRRVFLKLMSHERVDKVIKAIQWVWSHKEEVNSTLEWFGKVSAASSKGVALENQNAQESAKTNTYRLKILVPEKQVTVGQHIHLQVELQPNISDQNIIEIPHTIPEIYCFINTNGLQVLSSEVLTIPVDLDTGNPPPVTFELQAHLRGTRTYTIELFIENPNSGKLSIFKYEGQITVNPPKAPQDSLPILPMLDIRVAAQPDFVLQVATHLPDGEDGAHHLTYYLTSRLRDLKLRNQKVGTVVLQLTQLQRMYFLLNKTLQLATNVKPEDVREQMISLGRYLFDILFPAETTADFRNFFWQVADKISTWLIMEEGITWLLWELVVPYSDENSFHAQYFLCERYQLSHWIQGLGTPLYSEVPMGEIALANYKEQQDEEVQAWERLLQAYNCSGIRQAVNPDSPFYGLHLLRYSSELSRRDIVARDEATKATSPEEEVPLARLDLWLKRPVVTLSVLNQDNIVGNTNTHEWLLPERVLPFIKANASAVVGSWWQTSETAERVFWSHFYELLVRRLPLGEIVWRSRLAVERALPHSPDWLAYTLFGHPRAKPYQPETSSGYSILECLNPDEPFYTGKTYYFRVSVRKRPPVWYQERLIQTEELPDDLRALFMAPGLQTTFPEPVQMQPTGRNIRQATMSLTPEQEGDYQLVVQLLEGDELVKTLQLNMKVRGKANGSFNS